MTIDKGAVDNDFDQAFRYCAAHQDLTHHADSEQLSIAICQLSTTLQCLNIRFVPKLAQAFVYGANGAFI